jgi:hypothetical protein
MTVVEIDALIRPVDRGVDLADFHQCPRGVV